MDKLKSFDTLFEQKMFRIPDYQRGYAWQESHLEDFWNDIVQLPENRSHYTGTIMLQDITNKVKEDDKEHWLIKQHGYKMYHIVDGQQRVVTFLILVQALVEFLRERDEFKRKPVEEIFIAEGVSLKDVTDKFLFKTKNTYRSYKFAYSKDNLADEFFRYNILDKKGSSETSNTFYTLNMKTAKKYFKTQIANLYNEEGKGMAALAKIYTTLTQQFILDKRTLKDDFDVHASFETINNRGKSLSTFELLKNRLSYLITLLPDVDSAERRSLQNNINETWKEVYEQLGRNAEKPLDDDGFLWAHWYMYFYEESESYSAKEFLLDEKFTLGNVHNEGLPSDDIKDYLNSLKESAKHWFNQHAPYKAEELSTKEQDALDKLNRLGPRYFRPLIRALFVKDIKEGIRVCLLNRIERYIFLVFGLLQKRSNYKKEIFAGYAYQTYCEGLDVKGFEKELQEHSKLCFKNHTEPVINHAKILGDWYPWGALKYFLQEYELERAPNFRDPYTHNLKGHEVEHILPQTIDSNDNYWRELFPADDAEEDWRYYKNSLGNLLLLPKKLNSSASNKPFAKKKAIYKNGSYSEQKVSEYEDWTPEAIRERGCRLLSFMAKRWNFKFENEYAKQELLWIDDMDNLEEGDTPCPPEANDIAEALDPCE